MANTWRRLTCSSSLIHFSRICVSLMWTSFCSTLLQTCFLSPWWDRFYQVNSLRCNKKECDSWTLDSARDVPPSATALVRLGLVFRGAVRTVFTRVKLHHIWNVVRSGHWAHSFHSFLYCCCLCQTSRFIPLPEVTLLSRGTEIWGRVRDVFPNRKHGDVMRGANQTRSWSMTLQGNDETILAWPDFATKNSDFPVAGAATRIERLTRGIQPTLPVSELSK